MKKILLLINLVFCSYWIQAQIINQGKKDAEFAQYLLSTGQNKLVLQLGNDIANLHNNQQLIDSFNYFSGWAAYNLKLLDTSAVLLNKVPVTNPFYKKSHFFATYNLAHIHRYNDAQNCLNNISTEDTVSLALKQFSQAGLYLLNQDLTQYKNIRNNLNTDYYFYEQELKEFDNLANRLQLQPKKSVALAGIMSAIIPGSGKIYTNQYGEGIAAFFANAILAAIVVENYNKAGVTNYKTILYGTCFTAFYLGNIFGSMASVKVYKSDITTSHEKAVLYNLHISLRKYFD